MKSILRECDLEQMFASRQGTEWSVNELGKYVEQKLLDRYINRWRESLVTYSRLDLYMEVKDTYNQEDYLTRCNNRLNRSTIAKLRMGVYPLRVERGRYQNIPHSDRICLSCDLHEGGL